MYTAGPVWVYHRLPDLTHARHDALVHLVWSGAGLPLLTMASHVNLPFEWWIWSGRLCVYQGLPLCRSGPRPTVPHLYQPLPPRRRDRVRTHICRSIMEVVVRVGYAIHSGTQWRTVRTIKGGGTVGGRHRKENFFFIRPVGL